MSAAGCRGRAARMIAVTGANGYIGGRIVSHLRAAGGDPIELVRRPEADGRSSAAGQRARRYALAEPLEPSVLDGVETVVHAAWDLSARGPQVDCPACGSADTVRTAAFGGTACKDLYRCRACAEPFEHVKEI